ncbi:MAG: damage-control phosphatase ARMT1 family protein [Anaerolineae bacterium]
MKTYLDCYPCFLRQALEAARMTGATEAQQATVIHEVLELLQTADPEATPPETGDRVHRLVRRLVCAEGNDNGADPYADVKATATEQALALYPRLATLITEAPDPLEWAVRVAIAGNVIDFGPGAHYDLEGSLAEILHQPFAIDDMETFRGILARGGPILYLADNAGETVFDRVLIEALNHQEGAKHPSRITYAVKGGPTLNDATLDDAKAAGLDRVANLVTTGVDAPGTILARSSRAFRELYNQADVIIAKGQANYETLSPGDPRLFFLLKAKCPVIARDLGVPQGAIVIKRGGFDLSLEEAQC